MNCIANTTFWVQVNSSKKYVEDETRAFTYVDTNRFISSDSLDWEILKDRSFNPEQFLLKWLFDYNQITGNKTIPMTSKTSLEDLAFDFEFLKKLVVGIGEVAEITDVPVRKIRYWEKKGLISSITEKAGKNRRFDYKNIKKILLIKELIDQGYTLDAAAGKVEKRIDMVNQALEELKKKS